MTLSSYDQQKKFPAIIECNVGKGKAILSGVHFEYNPNLLDKTNPFLNPVIPKLQSDNDQRIRLLTHLFNRLNLRNGITRSDKDSTGRLAQDSLCDHA